MLIKVRDWENDEFGSSLKGWKTVAWSPVVVLEGLTCTRAAAADRLTYRIWVEAPNEVRLRRGLERDGETHRQLWLNSMRTERQFFTADATPARADLRVNGSRMSPTIRSPRSCCSTTRKKPPTLSLKQTRADSPRIKLPRLSNVLR